MKPLVSILIPAFNAARWVQATLRSALAQTWPRKEIILVDDGSSDKTAMIARRFAAKDVLVVSQPNMGASEARNRAFQLCQGDYIQWLDADDLLAPDKVALQMEEAEHLRDALVLLSSGFATFLHRVSQAAVCPSALWADLSPLEWLTRKMGRNLHMQTATWLVSRKLTEAAGRWDVRLSLDDDGEYFCRVLLASSGVRFVKSMAVFYRASAFNTLSTLNTSDKKLESQFLSMQLHVGYLLSLEDSDATRTACLYYLQTWFINFVAERPDLVEELQRLAQSLGGQLQLPPIRDKYKWVEHVFGYVAAKQTQLYLPRVKWQLLRAWDRILYEAERRSRGGNSDPVVGICRNPAYQE